MAVFRVLLIFAVLGLGAAWAADYEVSFAQAAKVGKVQIEAGRYKLRVQGSLVILTDSETNKSATVLARVEPTEKPAGFTAVIGSASGGYEHVEQIVLAGANFRLRFAN